MPSAPSLQDEPSTTVAAVDLGSNSFHMMVARAAGTELQIIDRLREPVRLAAGLAEDRRLSPEAQQRALECLQRFGQRLVNIPAHQVRAVGTNTMRRLKRGVDFHATAELALGHRIEIISGVEEARLVYGGVVHGMSRTHRKRLVVDIGGGSTELIIGRDAEPRIMESVGLGCVVHQSMFFENGEITRSKFRKARLAARVKLEFLERRYRRMGWDVAIGASGTVRGIWRVMRAEGWSDKEITREGLQKVISMVIDRGHVSKIDFNALREDRRPVFAGGLAVLAGVFDALEIEKMNTSDQALREGLVYDLLGRLSDQDVRDQSVDAMVKRYDVDRAHADAVAGTALKLLRQVQDAWQLDPKSSAMLLRWAARLHEIGLVIAHSSYHKHGEYIVRHADLQGFSQNDQRMLATLVRLHRGKLSNGVLDDLPTIHVDQIRRLSLLLRIASLLHRSRDPDLKPPVTVTPGRRKLDIAFSGNWLADRPLTLADLELEDNFLRSISWRLKIAA